MLPTLVANEMREAVGQFLRSAFPIATPRFQQAENGKSGAHALIEDLIDRPGALFKGPYLDIKLPFRHAQGEQLPFRTLNLPFLPYQHQLLAFQRLAGDSPQSTLVATGTGSGKTECFMFPVLDDCLNRRVQGIKTIVIYPMNALATDQAKRFAKTVAKLDTKLTVGLFIGGDDGEAETTMGPENVITCKKTLRKTPPDILLTNYKMLDFLLIRPKDRPLWRYNTPGMLRYLVVDELHSFDGAQGTDLACLIRRLRDRLKAGNELACVGTSATIGADSVTELLRYASEVFATSFDPAAIITEDRLSADEYLLGHTPEHRASRRQNIRYFHWPEVDDRRLDPNQYLTQENYLFHQARLWFADETPTALPKLDAKDAYSRASAAVELGELLHQHQIFHELIRAADNLVDLNQIAEAWQQYLEVPSVAPVRQLLSSLLSLVAAARVWNRKDSKDPKDWCHPLLNVRQQLWLRELRRLVCRVPQTGESAQLCFADDLKNLESPLHLPLLHCRECHLAAWGTVVAKGDNHIKADLQGFYQSWFSHSPQAHLLVPRAKNEASGDLRRVQTRKLCLKCRRLQPAMESARCVECDSESLVDVWMPDIVKKVNKGESERIQCHHDCPECGARDAMTIMGYRAATLISVMTSRLFATPYNDDYKLIAFSDSVQDAAHRAGFLGANTWRPVVRQAMVHWLYKQPVALSLREMADLMPGRWRDQIGDDRKFCGLFIPPNLEWHADFHQLLEQGNLPAGSQLPDMVSKRLAWECIAEFGRRSAIGRSLERTGAAVVGWDSGPLLTDIAKVAAQCREELGQLRDVSDAAFVYFVLGWLHHLRKISAIYDPSLEGYISNKGNDFLLNKISWMANFGRSQRSPAAVTLKHVSNNFETLVANTADTWSTDWLKKNLAAEALFAAADARQVFHLMLKNLTRTGWLVEKAAGNEPVWLLNPNRLLVEKNVRVLACDQCRHSLQSSESLLSYFTGMPCLRRHCRGHLQPAALLPPTRDYGVTAPRRLMAHEHTGLLPRAEREAVERSFIKGRKPWDINLLSATPTLEMGIDIGELSSVFLCSVPPAQANYLQRIGRAGRRDGNALAVTIANGQNHDLFFYEDPQEMMAGSVHTPGVFLKATAVLERQLIAYCFDRWNASGIDDAAIPAQLRKVLDAVQHGRLEQFPHNFLEYVSRHRTALLGGFLNLFPELDASAGEHLAQFIHDRGEKTLARKLINRVQELVKERAAILHKIKQLKLDADTLRSAPDDEATREHRDEVERERNALTSLVYSVNVQPVLNFFTDEGLLPNYAFPEEGVTLRSVILRRRSQKSQQEGESAYEKIPYLFQRPAQTALSELAPESRFYAVSHEMEIDQIDLQLSESELWRFCDRCQHTERVDIEDKHSACPKCGSAQWADSGQKHRVLKLRQVYSTVDDYKNRIGDDSEQREPKFFNRQMLVNIPADAGQGGFRLKSEVLPFGFEYLQRAVLREVNFGPLSGDLHNFAVAGREMPRGGFHVCRHCGKVQKEKRNDRPHAYTCPLFKKPHQATPDNFFSSLYLYREIESEAIRILLPLSEVAYSDEKLHSFIAALNLGLREYFHGNVQHLEVTDMREPPTPGSGERIYLVIYDRIPGGTGYLKELMRTSENLFGVLQKAWQKLATCSCIENENRDGCYRCILAYRDSRNMPTISRRAATELLADILAQKDQLEPVAELNSISTNVLIESKLEQKFLDALAQLPGARMTPRSIRGKSGALLSLPGANGKPISWMVEHQVILGPDEGVVLQTAVDVLLTPAREEDVKNCRPIAVYLDGLQYHHDIVADDVCKRSALLLSKNFWVYSLNWDDLPQPGKPINHPGLDLMRADGVMQEAMTKLYDGMAVSQQWLPAAEHRNAHALGSFDCLDRLLRDPQSAVNRFAQRAVFRAFTALVPNAAQDGNVQQKMQYELIENSPGFVRDQWNLEADIKIPGGFIDALSNSKGGVEMAVAVPMTAMKTGRLAETLTGAMVNVCFDDRDTSLNQHYKNSWRGFWHLVNQLQFLPRFSMATRRAVASEQLEQVYTTWTALRKSQVEPISQGEAESTRWKTVYELSLLDSAWLDELSQLDLPEPEVGVDLTGPEGEVVYSGDEVELCWLKSRVAVIRGSAKITLENWRFVEADGNFVKTIKEMMHNGAFL